MKKPIFYFEKLNTWDKVTIAIYILLTVFIYQSDNTIKHNWLVFYVVGTHVFIYLLNYKSLRKLNVWFIWFLISLFHLYMFFEFGDIPELQMNKGQSATGLQFTWVCLILFQILRFVSARTQGQELVPPHRSGTDIWDNRNMTFIDGLFFIIYMVIALGLDLIDVWLFSE